MADRRRGQSAVEFILLYGVVIVPMIFGIIFVSMAVWTWHAMGEFTREGARYAATHCWQGDSGNVVAYMQSRVPPVIDRDQFTGGVATIQVDYFQRDPDSGSLIPFSCNGDCSVECVPDTVAVSVTNYEFRRFFNWLRLPSVVMPGFRTSIPVAGAGCDPELNTCTP